MPNNLDAPQEIAKAETHEAGVACTPSQLHREAYGLLDMKNQESGHAASDHTTSKVLPEIIPFEPKHNEHGKVLPDIKHPDGRGEEAQVKVLPDIKHPNDTSDNLHAKELPSVIPPTTPADIDKLIKGRDQQRENNAHANFQHTIPDITLFDSLKAGAIH